jgi:hypothetical protein
VNGSANDDGQVRTFELRGRLPDGIAEAGIQEPLFGGEAVVHARSRAGAWGRAAMRCPPRPVDGAAAVASLTDALERAAAEALSS